MTKLMTIVALILVVLASPAFASDFVDYQNVNGSVNQFALNLDGKVHGKLGWNAWSVANGSWAEAYVGPTFNGGWYGLGASYGIESGNHGRFGTLGWVARGPVTAVGIWEKGNGTWHKATVDLKVSKHFKVGYHDQAFKGRGPRASVTFGKVSVWSALLMKRGTKPSLILAARVSN